MYMLRTAGQTAEPIGLKFFVDTHGWPGVVISLKKILNFIFQIFFHIFILFQKIFHGQRRALQLVITQPFNFCSLSLSLHCTIAVSNVHGLI